MITRATTDVRYGPPPRRGPHALRDLLALQSDELGRVDPVEVNLLVAQHLDSLQNIDIPEYQRMVDVWTDDFRRRLPEAEHHFRQTPGDWNNDIHFFRLGVLCWFLGEVLAIRYREDQKHLKSIRYTNPEDLFINGLIDAREGTCGNMPVLFLALTWRLGWPATLIVAGNHMLCRYDDGNVRHNIETTNFEGGGFRSPPDDFLRKERKIPELAVRNGSDLCPLTPKQMLGWFFGLRGRCFASVGTGTCLRVS